MCQKAKACTLGGIQKIKDFGLFMIRDPVTARIVLVCVKQLLLRGCKFAFTRWIKDYEAKAKEQQNLIEKIVQNSKVSTTTQLATEIGVVMIKDGFETFLQGNVFDSAYNLAISLGKGKLQKVIEHIPYIGGVAGAVFDITTDVVFGSLKELAQFYIQVTIYQNNLYQAGKQVLEILYSLAPFEIVCDGICPPVGSHYTLSWKPEFDAVQFEVGKTREQLLEELRKIFAGNVGIKKLDFDPRDDVAFVTLNIDKNKTPPDPARFRKSNLFTIEISKLPTYHLELKKDVESCGGLVVSAFRGTFPEKRENFRRAKMQIPSFVNRGPTQPLNIDEQQYGAIHALVREDVRRGPAVPLQGVTAITRDTEINNEEDEKSFYQYPEDKPSELLPPQFGVTKALSERERADGAEYAAVKRGIEERGRRDNVGTTSVFGGDDYGYGYQYQQSVLNPEEMQQFLSGVTKPISPNERTNNARFAATQQSIYDTEQERRNYEGTTRTTDQPTKSWWKWRY
jgi:hypothetical protein